jgi:hypothetical protein
LDIIKTRLQIQGEQIQVKNELALKNAKLLKYGMFGTAMNMGKNNKENQRGESFL